MYWWSGWCSYVAGVPGGDGFSALPGLSTAKENLTLLVPLFWLILRHFYLCWRLCCCLLLPLLLISLSLLASLPLLADVAVCLPQRCRQLCRYRTVLLVLLLVSLLLLESLLLASPVGFPALLLLVFLLFAAVAPICDVMCYMCRRL
jgi:hypothetical protein